MEIKPARIFSLGDNAVTVEFGNSISVPLNEAAVSLADHFTRNPFPGFVEAVPAYASTTIYYRPHEIRDRSGEGKTAFEVVKNFVTEASEKIDVSSDQAHRTISIPVSFDAEHALDLAFVAENSGLDPAEVIEIFLSTTYRVYMLGFLPGFAYMGIVDERIATPRRSAPRLSVPKGSVGIAGNQTGIYPAESPGGWQVIGTTNVELLTNDEQSPCIFSPGDHVRFEPAAAGELK